MSYNNTIKILPNIFISNGFQLNNDNIKNNNINNIIIINNYQNDIIDLNINGEEIKTTNITINNNFIDFNYTNNIILGTISKHKNIMIISEKNIFGFIILSGFMIGILKVSIFEIILLSKYYAIPIINTNYIKILFEYYKNEQAKLI